LDRHKGYPTVAHLAAIKLHGVVEIHRRSYAPIRRLLEA
jgi:ribonuclease HII